VSFFHLFNQLEVSASFQQCTDDLVREKHLYGQMIIDYISTQLYSFSLWKERVIQ